MHSLSFSLVAAGVLIAGSASPAAESPESPSTDGDLSTHSAMLFVSIWPSGVSEIRWNAEGQWHRALSNLNFSRLPSLIQWQVEGAAYLVQIAAGHVDEEFIGAMRENRALGPAGVPISWPPSALWPAPGGKASFLAGWDVAPRGAPTVENATAVIAALHAYHTSHQTLLEAAWAEQERQRPARELAQRAAEAARTVPGPGVRFRSVERAAPKPKAEVKSP